MRAASRLKAGALLAHRTGTVPGIAAIPDSPPAILALQRFKQRRGPFLLLADATSTALAMARWISPTLRNMAHQSWPGPVTLVFPGKPGLPAACYQHNNIAVRVDSDASVLQLARHCGGLLLSSSLNRRDRRPANPGYRHHMRHHRYIHARIANTNGGKMASKVIRVRRNKCAIIRQ